MSFEVWGVFKGYNVVFKNVIFARYNMVTLKLESGDVRIVQG